METKSKQKRKTIESIARGYNGRSYSCSKCKFERMCDLNRMDACADSYVRGFKKGMEYERKRNKK